MEKNYKSDNYTHILKYTSMFGGIQGLNILIGVIRNKLVALILGPNGMGLISLFTSTIKLVSDSTGLGLNMSAVKRISEDYNEVDINSVCHAVCLIRTLSFFSALLGMFLCIVLSPLLNSWTFVWGNHTLHFICLSLVVAFVAIIGGELAILKGTRHLKPLAKVSVLNVIAALATSVPLYYYYGQSGVVPSLIISSFIQMLLVLNASCRIFPYKLSFNSDMMSDGINIIKLGVAFVLAGLFGSASDFLIRIFLNHETSLDYVGLYSAGFMMTMTYAGMVFSAMDTDYFPRLSSVTGLSKMNVTVNQQIEVSLLIIAPLLTFFLIFLPFILPLLYSGKFLPVLGMMQVIVLAMFMRAIKLPMAYLPLAKGDSILYLFMEGIYSVIVVILVCFMFHYYGLTGAGFGITITSVLDFFMLLIVMRIKYKYYISKGVLKYIALLLPLGISAYILTFVENQLLYWTLGGGLILTSSIISLHILKSKTQLWNSLMKYRK